MSDLTPDEEQILAEMRAQVTADEAESMRFWEGYSRLPLDERKQLWARRILQQMRWQSESGIGDEFYMFTPDNYRDWKARDADMDVILDHLIAECDALHGDDGSLIEKLNERLGRDKRAPFEDLSPLPNQDRDRESVASKIADQLATLTETVEQAMAVGSESEPAAETGRGPDELQSSGASETP